MSTVLEMRSVGKSFGVIAEMRSADLSVEAGSVDADAGVLLGDPFVFSAENIGDFDF